VEKDCLKREVAANHLHVGMKGEARRSLQRAVVVTIHEEMRMLQSAESRLPDN
jgi:hypothetical protein